MKRFVLLLPSTLIWICGLFSAPAYAMKEFLTDKEIETIQDHQEIQMRVKFYLQFAEARLKAAEDRLNGTESEAGDPFEFYTPEDMLDGYYRILRSVMINLDDANRSPDPRVHPQVRKALKTLRGSTEKSLGQLEVLKKIAEEKKNEELWNLVNKAIDVTKGAHEGAASALAKEPETPAKRSRTR
jgi:hypothetical protein